MTMKKSFLTAVVCACCVTATACASQNAKPENTTESTTTQPTASQTDTTQVTTAINPTETATEKVTEKPVEIPTEIETETSVAKDYSQYLGTWTYKEVPDSIPEEILNDDTSYKMYMERLVSTTIEFKEIDGTTVNCLLYKGNIVTVAETNISGEIIDDQIEFSYTDSWNGKGHGTIMLQGDSVYLFCEEDEHGNGRIALNCDVTLSRVEN